MPNIFDGVFARK